MKTIHVNSDGSCNDPRHCGGCAGTHTENPNYSHHQVCNCHACIWDHEACMAFGY